MAADPAEQSRASSRTIAAWAGGMLCLVALTLAYLLAQSYRHYHASAEEVSQRLSQSLSSYLSAQLGTVSQALLAARDEFARLQRSGRFDAAAFEAYLRQQSRTLPAGATIAGTDRDGRVRYGEGAGSSPPPTAPERELLQRAQDEGGLLLSPPVRSGLPVALALRLPDGSFAGTVTIHLPMAEMQKLFGSVRVGQHGVVTLIDAQRRVLARHPWAESAAPGRPLVLTAPPVVDAIAARQSHASYTARSPVDGVARMLTLRQIGDFPAYVIIGLATEDFLAPWYGELAAAVGVFVLLCALSWAYWRNLHRQWHSELKLRAMQAGQEAHAELQAVIAAIPDRLFALDRQGRFLELPGGHQGAPFPPGHATPGLSLHETLPPSLAQQVQEALDEAARVGVSSGREIECTQEGESRWYELSVARKGAADDPACSLIVLARDVTERKRAQAQVEQLAYFDLLTHLPNRRLFLERLRQSLAASQRSGHHGALLFLDLDRFKTVNDCLGHQYGDLLLIQVAQRLRAVVRTEDVVARLGGDEFVVILERLAPRYEDAAGQALAVAEKLVHTLHGEYELDDRRFASSASVGVTLFHGNDASIEALLKRADASMYQAKGAGRNAVRFFDPQTQAELEARGEMEVALREAVVAQQFVLYYQPQVDQHGRCIGAEALVRWRCPRRGLLAPGQFLPLAEETGLMSPIGHWVVAEACRRLVAWQADPALRPLVLAINVSARQFAHPTFATELRELIAYHGTDPRQLQLELTENLLATRQDDALTRIRDLNAFGIGFAVDDFGTGQSSLACLKRLPLVQIKIDRSFTAGLLDNADDNAICRSIVALSHNLGIEVVAEGIENAEQWAQLRRLGCRRGQGYLFGYPVPADDFERWVAGQGGMDGGAGPTLN